jgi:large subunit ribosomal protein L29
MKNSEIVELSTNDLFDKIEDTKAHLSKLKLNHAITPLDNPNKIKEARRLIARLMTELHKRNMKGE